MSSRNINFNYIQLIIKNRILNGLYTMYSEITKYYNSLVDSNKVNNMTISIDDLIKKSLQGIPNLSISSIENEFKLIITENNLTEEVYDELFYGVFLEIVNSISDNKDFIKNIKPQLQNINKYDFIKKCYIQISKIILQNEYFYLINIKNNSFSDNVAYSEMIKECILETFYNCINLKNIIPYSKKFKDDIEHEVKDYTNDLNELKQQIKIVSDNLTLLKNNINNYVPPQQITETKIDLPSIDIPIGPNVHNEQQNNVTKEDSLQKNNIVSEKENNQEIQNKTETILKNIMILSDQKEQENKEQPEQQKEDNQQIKNESEDINKLINDEIQSKMNTIEPIEQTGGENKKEQKDESEDIIESMNLEESIDPNNIDIDSFLNKI